ncbi:MAG: hypothetical protein ACJAV7_000758 [Flavobacteriales bacterium]
MLSELSKKDTNLISGSGGYSAFGKQALKTAQIINNPITFRILTKLEIIYFDPVTNSTNQQQQRSELKGRLTNTLSPEEFDVLSLDIFRYQAEFLPIYKNFLDALNIAPHTINNPADIPFLPISFFKSQVIMSSSQTPELIFKSSGTSGQTRAEHHVADTALYNWSLVEGFKMVYGDPNQYSFLALLPSYLENGDSSLVHMVNALMELSGKHRSGFYLSNFDLLKDQIIQNRIDNIPTILIGVSFALLDFGEQFSLEKGPEVVMETGGMKGRRKEIIRSELHKSLSETLGVPLIHSEYGMTELLSQAYSKGNGRFNCPPWMRVEIRDVRDPRSWVKCGKTGGVNVIDLANIDSCAFIETSDLGRKYEDDSFEILGRFDSADVRGCNLLFA